MHVAELGSLSKAADRLNVAQPALSRQIRLLEEELGTRLFERHGRGMIITDVGREVAARAARVVAELDGIQTHVRELGETLMGRVSIGTAASVATIISVPLVAAFRASHPRVQLRLVSALNGDLIDGLHKGDLDIALLYDPQPTRSLRVTPLLVESLYLVGPADARLSPQKPWLFSRLKEETLLLPSERHGIRMIVERCAAGAGIPLNVGLEADSMLTLKDLAAAGFGMTVLPLPSVHADIIAGKLSAAPLIKPSPIRRNVIALPADRPISRVTSFAAATIASVARCLVKEGVWQGELIKKA